MQLNLMMHVAAVGELRRHPPLLQALRRPLVPHSEVRRWMSCSLKIRYLVPCITPKRLLHQYPFMLPHQRVDKGAIKFVLSGANIMCPGLTHPNAKMTTVDKECRNWIDIFPRCFLIFSEVVCC